MSFDYTQKVLDAVDRARRSVSSAESRFESAKSRIEIEARYTTINISNLSKAAEIVANIKRTTDDLYTSYETIIRTLDMECRPYLEFNVSGDAIKAVADLMKEINEESSSLSSNVTGTFNSSSMGDLRSEHYFASLEAKTIEKFWATKYSMTPEAEEERKRRDALIAERRRKAAEREKLEAERRKKEAEEKKRKAELKAEEEKRVAKLNEEAKKHMLQIEKQCNKKIAEYKKELDAFIEGKKQQFEGEIQQKIEELKKTIDDLKQQEAQLKAFKFSEKKRIKEELQKLEARVLKFEKTDIVNVEISAMRDKVPELVDKYQKKLDSYMAKRFSDYNNSTDKKSKTTLLYVEKPEMASKPIPDAEKPEKAFE